METVVQVLVKDHETTIVAECPRLIANNDVESKSNLTLSKGIGGGGIIKFRSITKRGLIAFFTMPILFSSIFINTSKFSTYCHNIRTLFGSVLKICPDSVVSKNY